VVSEFAQENLAQILPNRPLNPTEAEYMLRSVLEVLAYLHGQGLAHGRLKPGNIMAVNEELKVSGDSISRPGERPFGQAQPTVYDPPELTTSGLSPAGDVWSLGATLVEVLTQHASVGDGIRQGDLTLPESLPAPFLEIARQCLRLDPQRRWTVPDIAARLLPASLPPKKKPSLRYGIAAATAGIIVVAVLAGSRYSNHDSHSIPRTETTIEKPGPTESARNRPEVTPSDANASKHSVKSDVANNGTVSPHSSASSPMANAPSAKMPGSVTEQFLPPVSRKSRDTITGKVRVGVKVGVDTSGKVVKASLTSPGPSQYFAKLALDASRRWKFAPPQVNGEPVPSEWTIRFYFGRQTTEVHPAQTAP